MANTIRGNKDGENGENQTYTILGRGSAIPREQVVREIKQGYAFVGVVTNESRM
jgi:hypothetical protein